MRFLTLLALVPVLLTGCVSTTNVYSGAESEFNVNWDADQLDWERKTLGPVSYRTVFGIPFKSSKNQNTMVLNFNGTNVRAGSERVGGLAVLTYFLMNLGWALPVINGDLDMEDIQPVPILAPFITGRINETLWRPFHMRNAQSMMVQDFGKGDRFDVLSCPTITLESTRGFFGSNTVGTMEGLIGTVKTSELED